MNLQEYKNCLDKIDQSDLEKLSDIIRNSKDIIILGNGGSNSVSCHIAQDYTKQLGIKTLCFGDSSRLTCYANDYGWNHAYTKFIEHFANSETLVILISSSGNSENILNAAAYCIDKLKLITLSGFDSNNKLRLCFTDKSLLHFYINSHDYGIVECIHELILHSVL